MSRCTGVRARPVYICVAYVCVRVCRGLTRTVSQTAGTANENGWSPRTTIEKRTDYSDAGARARLLIGRYFGWLKGGRGEDLSAAYFKFSRSLLPREVYSRSRENHFINKSTAKADPARQIDEWIRRKR